MDLNSTRTAANTITPEAPKVSLGQELTDYYAKDYDNLVAEGVTPQTLARQYYDNSPSKGDSDFDTWASSHGVHDFMSSAQGVAEKAKEQRVFDEAKPADRGFLAGTAAALGRGAMSAVGAVGQTMGLADLTPASIDTDKGYLDRTGESLVKWSEDQKATTQFMRPTVAEETDANGAVKKAWEGGVESMVTSAAPIAAGFAGAKAGGAAGAAVGSMFGPAGTAAGAAIGGTIGGLGAYGLARFGMFGAGVYGDTYDKTYAELKQKNPGMAEEEVRRIATKGAWIDAASENVSEAVGDAAAYFTFGGTKVLQQPLTASIKDVMKRGIKGIATDVAKQMPFEVGSEVANAAVGAQWRQEAGLDGGDMQTAMVDAIGPAVVMSLLMGGGVAGYTEVKARKALNDINSADPNVRAKTANEITGQILERTKDEELAQTWNREAFASIEAGEPIKIDEQLAKFGANKARIDAVDNGEDVNVIPDESEVAAEVEAQLSPAESLLTDGVKTTPEAMLMGEYTPVVEQDAPSAILDQEIEASSPAVGNIQEAQAQPMQSRALTEDISAPLQSSAPEADVDTQVANAFAERDLAAQDRMLAVEWDAGERLRTARNVIAQVDAKKGRAKKQDLVAKQEAQQEVKRIVAQYPNLETLLADPTRNMVPTTEEARTMAGTMPVAPIAPPQMDKQSVAAIKKIETQIAKIEKTPIEKRGAQRQTKLENLKMELASLRNAAQPMPLMEGGYGQAAADGGMGGGNGIGVEQGTIGQVGAVSEPISSGISQGLQPAVAAGNFEQGASTLDEITRHAEGIHDRLVADGALTQDEVDQIRSIEIDDPNYVVSSRQQELIAIAHVRTAQKRTYDRTVGRILKGGGIHPEMVVRDYGADGAQWLRSRFGLNIISNAGQPLDVWAQILSEEVQEAGIRGDADRLYSLLREEWPSLKRITDDYRSYADALREDIKSAQTQMAEREEYRQGKISPAPSPIAAPPSAVDEGAISAPVVEQNAKPVATEEGLLQGAEAQSVGSLATSDKNSVANGQAAPTVKESLSVEQGVENVSSKADRPTVSAETVTAPSQGEASPVVEQSQAKAPANAGMRKATKAGAARVAEAKKAMAAIVNNPDIVGKDRADRIENARNLVYFLESNAANDIDTGYEFGDKVAYTGEDAPEGMRTFIFLEGAKAGQSGVAATKEARAARATKAQDDFKKQQDEFSKLKAQSRPSQPSTQGPQNEERQAETEALLGDGAGVMPAPVQEEKVGAKTVEKIEDFGEKIEGAKKDLWTGMREKMTAVSDDDIGSHPFSKTWPLPDYQAMLDSGVDKEVVSYVRALRDAIPNKPGSSRRSAYKAVAWEKLVRDMRRLALDILDGSLPVANVRSVLSKGSANNSVTSAVRDQAELYMLVGHEKSLAGLSLQAGEYSLLNGVEYKPAKVIWAVEQKQKATAFSNFPKMLATGATREEAIADFKKKYDSLTINEPASKQVEFDIYSKQGTNGFFIGKKVGRNHIDLVGPLATVKEAREYKKDKHAELVDRLAKAKEIPNERRDTNNPRVGEDMRGGQDVTPEMFTESFGFKGVQFGNYVEQGRRQEDLNEAFDALMDMAAILGVPPKAISLNGELGLAFGARGSGGIGAASAHYEPEKIVINLTKKRGAGSIGHEWWHALDNYFSRMRNKKTDMMTDATDVSLVERGADFYRNYSAVRDEMIEAFGGVMKAIRQTAIKARSTKIDNKRTKEYWTLKPEMSARAFESYLISKLHDQGASNDYLANIVDEETWKAAESLGFELEDSYPYATAGEVPVIRAAFDEFFNTVETKETDKGVALYQLATSTPSPIDIRAAFPWADSITEQDGRTVVTKGKVSFTIEQVETISPNEVAFRTSYGRNRGASEQIAGEYLPGKATIRLSKVADKWTVQHEYEHFLEDMGLITPFERGVLDAAIKRDTKAGTLKFSIGEGKDRLSPAELRAYYVQNELATRDFNRKTTLGRVLQKVADFIDALANLFVRTSRGVVRDVESGAMMGRESLRADVMEGMRGFQTKEVSDMGGGMSKQIPSKSEIIDILSTHNLVKLKEKPKRIFAVGSFATGKQNDRSDIDILIEISPKKNGDTALDVEAVYRRKLQNFFVKNNIRGQRDDLHPNWMNRRVDVYFTYDADKEQRPKIELTDGERGGEAPSAQYALPTSTTEALQKGRELKEDILYSPETFGWLKNINTQYHKARQSPAYKRILDRVHEAAGTQGRAAARAAGLAKDILPDYAEGFMQTVRELSPFAKKKFTAADLSHVSRIMSLGTLAGKDPSPFSGHRLTDADRSQFKTDAEYQAALDKTEIGRMLNGETVNVGGADVSMSKVQVDLYRQSRAALDQMVREMATSEAWRNIRGVLTDVSLADGEVFDSKENWRAFVENPNGADVIMASMLKAELRKADARITQAEMAAHALANVDTMEDFTQYGKDLYALIKKQKDATKFTKKQIEDGDLDEITAKREEEIDAMAEKLGISPEEPKEELKAFLKATKEYRAAVQHKTNVTEAQATVEKIFSDSDKLVDAGYTPLSRFGKYRVIVEFKDKKQLPLIKHYDTSTEAAIDRRKLERAFSGMDATVGEVKRTSEEAWRMYQGANPEALMLFAQKAGAESGELLQTYYQEALSSRSALKKLITRKGYAGYSEDLQRILASFITSGAKRVATNYHAADINEIMSDMAKQEKEGKLSGDVLDEAVNMKKFVDDPGDTGSGFRSFAANYYMLGSMMSAAWNGTQVVTSTLPELYKYSGSMSKSAMDIFKAYRSIARKGEDYTPEEKTALKRAMQDGTVDAAENHHLYGQAIKRFINKLGNGEVARKAGAFLRLWGMPFAWFETMNRKASFIAAIRQAHDMGMDGEEAYAFAKQIVDVTQGIYQKHNRMNMARSAVGGAVLTFAQYKIMTLEQIARNAKEGGQARKAAALQLAIIAAMGGWAALPAVEDIMDLFDALMQTLGGKAWLTKKKIREAVESGSKEAAGLILEKSAADAVGQFMADFVNTGISAALPADFSARSSQGSLWPGAKLLKPSTQFRDSEVFEMAGVPGSMIQSLIDASGMILQGDMGRAAMRLAPNAVGAAIKGVDIGLTGEIRNTRGKKVADGSPLDAALQTVGAQPKEKSRINTRLRENQELKFLTQSTEKSIVSEWADAYEKKGVVAQREALVAVRKRIADWNSANPDWPIVVKQTQVMNELKNRKKTTVQLASKSAPKELRRSMAVE